MAKFARSLSEAFSKVFGNNSVPVVVNNFRSSKTRRGKDDGFSFGSPSDYPSTQLGKVHLSLSLASRWNGTLKSCGAFLKVGILLANFHYSRREADLGHLPWPRPSPVGLPQPGRWRQLGRPGTNPGTAPRRTGVLIAGGGPPQSDSLPIHLQLVLISEPQKGWRSPGKP